MNGIDLSRNAAGLLIRINAITGWRLPDDAQLAQVLNAEFAEYLRTNLADMNSKEVISAIREYGLHIIEWGKSMNLSFIDQCVITYKTKRLSLSEMEDRHSIDQKQPKKEEIYSGLVDWSSEWFKVLYAAKIGQIKNAWISVDLYDWLIREGKLQAPSKEDKWETVKQCAAQYLVDIKDALLSGAGTEPPFEIKRRIALLENTEHPFWKKDTVIMSTLAVMAKKDMVRQLAISEALNE